MNEPGVYNVIRGKLTWYWLRLNSHLVRPFLSQHVLRYSTRLQFCERVPKLALAVMNPLQEPSSEMSQACFVCMLNLYIDGVQTVVVLSSTLVLALEIIKPTHPGNSQICDELTDRMPEAFTPFAVGEAEPTALEGMIDHLTWPSVAKHVKNRHGETDVIQVPVQKTPLHARAM